MEGVFSHHEPCPRCGSRDNLGVWSDGHKFCFGCHLYVHAPLQLPKPHITPKNQDLNSDSNWRDYCTDRLPAYAVAWLRKYGITDEEVSIFGILYETRRDALVFPLGSGETRVYRFLRRSEGSPKALTRGTREHGVFLHRGEGNPLAVFVEDVVSAIKVARVCNAYPCLGSDVPPGALRTACGRFSGVGIWLDRDMAVKAVKTALKARVSTSVPVYAIVTDLDPKEYSTGSIVNIVSKTFY